MKIAVIDDEDGIRGVIRELLEDEGHDIVEAGNGVTGLDVIRREAPDLILCDIRMPQMTGDELFDVLRQSESDFGMVPFIFLSGDANTTEQIKRLNKGADDCFEKPVNLRLLAARINAHLSRVTRVSDFIQRKLDSIAGSLPKAIEHEFSLYRSLTTNTHGYISVIISVIHDCIGDKESCSQPQSILANELNYVRYCLNRFKVRRELVRAANGEDLSWTLIFMVIQAQLEGMTIYVSDLYVSIPSAKSTINARISSLIEDGIFIKTGDLTDGRRQQILLTENFKLELMEHINASIDMVKQVS